MDIQTFTENTRMKKTREMILEEINGIIEEKTGMKLNSQSNFLESGGNSIIAAQIIGDINQKYTVDLQISELLDISNMDDFINKVIDEILTKGNITIGPGTIKNQVVHPDFTETKWPLTSDQERIWFLDQINPGNPAFNIYTALRIKGQFRIDVLGRSFNLLLKRHELLRAQFVFEHNKVFQEIKEINPVTVPVEEINEGEIDVKLKAEAAKGMDIPGGNLVRIKVFKITETDLILFLNIHHIIADAWSVGILIEDLMKIYLKVAEGKEAEIENLRSRFSDFIHYQNKVIKEKQEKQLAYWKEALKSVPTCISLPYDLERPPVLSYKAGYIRFELRKELVQSIKKLAVESKVTIFNFLYSAFTTLLHIASNQNEFLIGCPIANRKLSDFNKIIGFLTNTLVMKNIFSPDLDIAGLMKQNHNYSKSAFDHSDIPYMTIVQNIANNRVFNYNPLFQVMFSMMQVPDNSAWGGYSVQNINSFSGYSDYDIFLTMEVSNEEIKGSFTYSKDVFVEQTAQSLAAGYLSVIEQCIQNPYIKLNTLHIPDDLQNVIQKHKMSNYKQQIVISSTFSDQPLQEIIDFWMKKLHIPSSVLLADYNQVFHQLLDFNQLMIKNKDGVNIVLIRLEDWIRYSDSKNKPDNGKSSITGICEDFIRALQGTADSFAVPLIVSILPSRQTPDGISNETKELLTDKILSSIHQLHNIYLLKTEEIQGWYPVNGIFDEVTDKEGHLPFTPDFYKALGTSLARKVYAIKRHPFKVIVLDCDNTLWNGIAGEDDIEKIEIDPARTAFQALMKEQKESGMLLCLVTKNEESDIQKVFTEKNGMVLAPDDFTVIKANWELKSENIKAIAHELNLGLDSFIFIDDSPLECAEVSSAIRALLTVQFPLEQEEIFNLMTHGWFFDHLKITEEDKSRTMMYKENLLRKQESEKHVTFEDFYNALQLEIDINGIENQDIPRVSQLTQRTNQFNTTTIRRTENEIKEFLSNGKNKCLSVRVKDRFGAYGLVGTAFYTLSDGIIKVESLLLSCRVLGKGVEHSMLRGILENAEENPANTIVIPFYWTSKNTPAYKFLNSIGCEKNEKIENGELFYFSPARIKELKYNPSVHEVPIISVPIISVPVIPEQKENAGQKITGRIDQEILLEIISEYNNVNAMRIKSPSLKLSASSITGPENEVQERIIKLAKEVLNVNQISIDENFFDMGGHSLQLVQLLSVLQKEFQCTIQIIDLFQYTNIRKLADYLSHGDTSSNLKKTRERGEQQRQRMMALKTKSK